MGVSCITKESLSKIRPQLYSPLFLFCIKSCTEVSLFSVWFVFLKMLKSSNDTCSFMLFVSLTPYQLPFRWRTEYPSSDIRHTHSLICVTRRLCTLRGSLEAACTTKRISSEWKENESSKNKFLSFFMHILCGEVANVVRCVRLKFFI